MRLRSSSPPLSHSHSLLTPPNLTPHATASPPGAAELQQYTPGGVGMVPPSSLYATTQQQQQQLPHKLSRLGPSQTGAIVLPPDQPGTPSMAAPGAAALSPPRPALTVPPLNLQVRWGRSSVCSTRGRGFEIACCRCYQQQEQKGRVTDRVLPSKEALGRRPCACSGCCCRH
jgi:hypothetical protein